MTFAIPFQEILSRSPHRQGKPRVGPVNAGINYTRKYKISHLSNCIMVNVTLRSNVASGKMLLTDRRISLLEEQHDESEKQTGIEGSGSTEILESE
jgi:hypothetical protein